MIDLLFDGTSFLEFHTPRIAGRVHGTGCTFASAVASGLASGLPLADSAEQAQRYVAGAMAHAVAVGRGTPLLDHFWRTRSA